MRKVLVLFLFLAQCIYAQKFTISGFVEDASSGERLIGAAVYETKWHRYGTTTNEYGYFSLTLPAGKINLKVSYLGFKPLDTIIDLQSDIQVVFRLVSTAHLPEVVVTTYKQDVKNTQTGKIVLPLKEIQTLPVIFGEPDLLKFLQLMPGIQMGSELSSGIYVRGGSPDQNLILLDGIPLYNIFHMGGMFSIFTPNAIKAVNVYKSGFPARYGGRLSSVLDIRMKDGNMKDWKANLNVGVISSNFTIEGPIVKDKVSFIASFRRTYWDIIAYPFIKIFGRVEEEYGSKDSVYYYDKMSNIGGYYFYDFYSKITAQLTPNDRVYFSLYSGLDKFYYKYQEQNYSWFYGDEELSELNVDMGTAWGNSLAALRWSHSFSKKLFSNLTLTYSKYKLQNSIIDDEKIYDNDTLDWSNYLNAKYLVSINDWSARYELQWQPNDNHFIRLGSEYIYHIFDPGKIYYKFRGCEPACAEVDTSFGYSRLYSNEFAVYLEDDFEVSNNLAFNLGMRYSLYSIRKQLFTNIEPRISMRLSLSDNLAFKASYARMAQNVHYLTSNMSFLPLDMWVLATDKVVPENSWQVAGGLWWIIRDKFSGSLEVYYKKMNNLIEYKSGRGFISLAVPADISWEEQVTQGIGYSYGLDLLLRKDVGRLKGWIGYSLAWTIRQFPEINFGKPFPYKYDRRHEIKLALNYQLKRNIDFGATWVYGSGNPITMPVASIFNPIYPFYGSYTFDFDRWYTEGILLYESRNNYRLPAYHRLDISFNFKKLKKKGLRTWTIGVYNVYNHINPLIVFVEPNYIYGGYGYQIEYKLKIISLFQFMPFVSYRFQWK